MLPALPVLKQRLLEAGFEVYRTLSDRVVLAERVRDNLIMDSGVAVVVQGRQGVQVALRAQATEFPGEAPEALRARVERLGEPLTSEGWEVLDRPVTTVPDPVAPGRVLDTWYEMVLFQAADTEQGVVALCRRALERPRVAAR